MQLIYENTDMTDFADIVSCVHRDVSGGRCDCLEIELENAEAWYRWQPQRDDAIRVIADGYDTGRLCLNAMLPQDGRYRILASSLPGAARRKAYASYENLILAAVLGSCAAECRMDSGLYGVEGSLRYPYLLREKEGAAAFAERMLRREGAVLKCVNGRMAGISVQHVQEMEPAQIIEITAGQEGVTHLRREDSRLAGITVKTPYVTCHAADTGAPNGAWEILTDCPAADEAAAGRWARGLLLMRNRLAEELTIDMTFTPGLTAMTRVDIASAADAAGAWLVDEVEHDFIRQTSRVKLLRCLTTIV